MKNKIYIHKKIYGLAGFKELLSKRKYMGIIYLIFRVQIGQLVKKCKCEWIYFATIFLPDGETDIPYPSQKIGTEREMIKIAKGYIEKNVDKSGQGN
jgi:hypothetical protein